MLRFAAAAVAAALGGDGMAMMRLPDDRWWACAIVGGSVLLDSDQFVSLDHACRMARNTLAVSPAASLISNDPVSLAACGLTCSAVSMTDCLAHPCAPAKRLLPPKARHALVGTAIGLALAAGSGGYVLFVQLEAQRKAAEAAAAKALAEAERAKRPSPEVAAAMAIGQWLKLQQLPSAPSLLTEIVQRQSALPLDVNGWRFDRLSCARGSTAQPDPFACAFSYQRNAFAGDFTLPLSAVGLGHAAVSFIPTSATLPVLNHESAAAFLQAGHAELLTLLAYAKDAGATAVMSDMSAPVKGLLLPVNAPYSVVQQAFSLSGPTHLRDILRRMPRNVLVQAFSADLGSHGQFTFSGVLIHRAETLGNL
ncbi:hypothetical protein [Chitinimonas sp. BJB300]|uniref:hypothetical protein n=1 Tax=Chitinimonas sp. BJB300 TaxID=1559339 RepID=UPI0035B56CEF